MKSDKTVSLLVDLIDEFTESFDVFQLDGEFVGEDEDWVVETIRVNVGIFLTMWYLGSTSYLDTSTSSLHFFAWFFFTAACSQSLVTTAVIRSIADAALWILSARERPSAITFKESSTY